MTRRRWKIAAVILITAGLVTIAGLVLMMASLLCVTFDLLEIVSIPHG